MPDLNDQDLVREFAREKSEAAFAALVRQHVNLVFATALRQIGDRAAAEEITQTVFVALAQSAGKLGSHPTIAGWLHQTALNKSREWLRSELRRRRREEIAVSLAEARAEGDSVWAPLVPLLDEALLQLRDADRAAVIMHFMEGRTFQEVGSVLGVGEDTARKRVNRCLEQLTKFFQRQGFTVPTLSATAPLFALASHTAPANLAAAATSAGFAAAHSTSTLTLIKGALKIMAWTKTKTGIIAAAVVLLAIGIPTLTIKEIQAHKKYPWEIPNANFGVFYKMPATIKVVPTKFTKDGGWCSDGTRGAMGIAQPLKEIIQAAYQEDKLHTLVAVDLPPNKYDFFAKLVGPQEPHKIMPINTNWTIELQKEITRKFGIQGRLEMHATDVLVLKPSNTGVHGFKISHQMPHGQAMTDMPGNCSFFEQPISTLTDLLEQRFQIPIVDQTSLPKAYDFALTWNETNQKQPNLDGLKQALHDQLGLDLVATNMPVEMLVVTKAN